MKIKDWYNAQELADLNLGSLPKTKAGVIYQAKKGAWINRKRIAKGGGVEYSFDSLPDDVKAEILLKSYKALIKTKTKDVMVVGRDLSELTGEDRDTADARLRMVLLVEKYKVELGSRERAYEIISKLSRENALPDDYNQVCEQAQAKKTKKVGVGKRILQQWCLLADKASTPAERLALLAPKKQGKPEIDPLNVDWLPLFMDIYQNPNGISVAESYRYFCTEYVYRYKNEAVPSINSVRATLNKLPEWVRMRKRLTGAAMRGIRGFVRRDWNADFMLANDIWVGDGHSLKMLVAHPINGRRMQPELTLIMDAPSRYIVGWSLGYSENQIAVGDALRHAMTRHGVPAIYYSDNGKGQANKSFDTDMTGMFARLGINHATGIPGNAQGRGIIERQMKEVPRRVARAFATYFGKDADPETTRKMLSAMSSYSNAVISGKTDEQLTTKQTWAKSKLPTWYELVAEIEKQVEDYNNNRIHNSIGKTPAQKRAEMLEDMGDDMLIQLSETEARDLFRPCFERTVQRGEVRWENQYYYHEALEHITDKKVNVYVDLHDASFVIVRDLEGRLICEAKLNRTDAFAQAYVEKSREKRIKGQQKRQLDKLAAIQADNRKMIEHEAMQTLVDLAEMTEQSNTNIEKEYAMWEPELDPDWTFEKALKAI